MNKKYHVDFFDMNDGWIGYRYIETDDLDIAKAKAVELQKQLSVSNIRCGEHYGVISSETKKEIYCLEKIYP